MQEEPEKVIIKKSNVIFEFNWKGYALLKHFSVHYSSFLISTRFFAATFDWVVLQNCDLVYLIK